MRQQLRRFFCQIAVSGLSFLLISCASTGPKVSKAELQKHEEEFNLKFFEASGTWLPRIYRVGYQLIKSPVPGHGNAEPEFNFTGIGVDDLDKTYRKVYAIDEKIKGVIVIGHYPGSLAENADVQAGDVILKIDGKPVKNIGGYFKKIRSAKNSTVKAEVLKKGQVSEVDLPVEKVYYNAQFFLAPTPDLDANAAFSKINVGIGAIRYCKNDDELAVIMGHELAHVTLKHSLKKMGAGIATGMAYGAVAGVIDAFTVPGLGNLVISPVSGATDAAVSRRYEREADYFGMQHAFHSGFDVGQGARVFSRLATDTPGFTLLAYTFSSHPKSPERFLRLEKMIEEFQTQYPAKFPMAGSPDWDIVIPMKEGETIEEAVNRLLEAERQKKAEPASSITSVPALQPAPAAA